MSFGSSVPLCPVCRIRMTKDIPGTAGVWSCISHGDWTGGGVAFPPTPRDFEVKVNRKTRRSALRGVLSQHAADGTFGVLDGSSFLAPSTRDAVELLAKWGKELPVVVVTKDEQNVVKSFRNIDKVVVTTPGELEVTALVWARSVLVTQDALDLVKDKASS